MKSPIGRIKRMTQSKTLTSTQHCLHHMNQPMHWSKKETVMMNRKGRK